MKKKLGRATVLAVVLALVAGGSWLGYRYLRAQPQQHRAVTASPLSQSDQSRLEMALGSANTATQDNALTPDFVDALHGQRVVPVGTTITLQPATFHSSGTYGIVNAVAGQTGKQPALIALLLIRRNSTSPWRVVTLLPVASTKAYVADTGSNDISSTTASRYAKASTTGCDSVAKGKTPVLFIHGFNEKPAVWGAPNDQKSMRAVIASVSGVNVMAPFDYSQYSIDWVTNPAIGGALAARILCLSQASRSAGGNGKVVVIAHSMGGLAVKEAIREQPQVAQDLGLVITIATPNDGSVLDAQLLSTMAAYCAVQDCLSLYTAALAIFSALPGLAAGSPLLAQLGGWPAGVPVYAIAGNIAPQKFVLLWNNNGLPYFAPIQGPLSGSDTLVTVGSALHGQVTNGLGGKKEVDCTTTAYVVLPNVTHAPCDHGQLLQNSDVEKAVVQEVQDYLNKVPVPVVPPQPTFSCPTATEFANIAKQGINHSQGPVVAQARTVSAVICQSNWAEAEIDANLTSGGMTDGAVLLHYVSGMWQFVTVGSSFSMSGQVCQEVPPKVRAAMCT